MLYNVRCLCLAFGLNTQLLLIFSVYFCETALIISYVELADITVKLNLFYQAEFIQDFKLSLFSFILIYKLYS